MLGDRPLQPGLGPDRNTIWARHFPISLRITLRNLSRLVPFVLFVPGLLGFCIRQATSIPISLTPLTSGFAPRAVTAGLIQCRRKGCSIVSMLAGHALSSANGGRIN